ncbi:aminopeptidase PepB [Thaumasiovibrio subtropicus]|uniref:aminopeptidase PepB n=1 Tax=Thaumasiovibrio subtropicus TaxID=1891207 RepID=UPI000B34E162|nr:aminopeptidase PepB [Thaumasiovibrio subtropicus]
MSVEMSVFLTNDAAAPQWGAKALLSFTESGAQIHLTKQSPLAAIQRAARKLDNQGIKTVTLAGDNWDLEAAWAFVQGYRNAKKSNTLTLPQFEDADQKELDSRIQITDWVRDIINQPGDEVAPRQLASRAAELIKSLAPEQVKYKIIKGVDLLDEGWSGIYTVGRGSKRSPSMLRLDFNPTGDEDAPVHTVLVGKGITFDTGGYSLKPSAGMMAMKADMGGAALATGALAFAISRGLNKRVKLVLCCAENMISSSAYKLGDIIKYKNDKTVEVQNTDAEGRLVMADGLIYANTQNPQRVIDVATLTGAAKMALGNDYHAIMSFDESFTADALASAKEENEGMWPLPLEEFHRDMLPSQYADLSNIASGDFAPGATTAAAFLSHFVDEYQTGWLHVDASGTFRKSPTDKWAAGATGMGVRTLGNLILKGE